MSAHVRMLATTTAAVALMGLTVPAVATEASPSTPLGSAAGVRYKTSTAQLAGNSTFSTTTQEVSASCDPDWDAVSGGQSVNARAEQGFSDAWTNGGAEWSTEAWQRDAPESRLASYVVCLKTDELSSVTENSLDIPADAPVSRGVWCDEGSAVSGGFFAGGSPADFALNAGYPVDGGDSDLTPDDGWLSYVDYTGEGGDHISFSVRCLENTSLTYRSRTVGLPPGAPVSARAVCPKGSPVVGGGVYVTGAAHLSHVVASRPWDSKDAKKVPEDGWRGGIVNTSSIELSMTVHAVCRGAASN